MNDRVDLSRFDDALKDPVGLLGAHKLGAFEGEARVVGVDAHNDFNFVDLFEDPGDVPAPEGAETRNEDTHCDSYPNQTLLRSESMS